MSSRIRTRLSTVARRALFVEAPRRRNRVWQTDFTEVETSQGGTWRISPVVDYAAKLALATPVSGTTGARDAIAAVKAAIREAERLMVGSLGPKIYASLHRARDRKKKP